MHKTKNYFISYVFINTITSYWKKYNFDSIICKFVIVLSGICMEINKLNIFFVKNFHKITFTICYTKAKPMLEKLLKQTFYF